MTPIAASARPLSYWAPHWMPPVLAPAHGDVACPEFLGSEVEIARVVVDTVVPEVFSLRARRARLGRPYRYRLVDAEGAEVALPGSGGGGPLSLEELVALLDGAVTRALPLAGRPFVEGVVHATLDAGTVAPGEASTAIRVESAVYAPLASVYRPRVVAAVRAWVQAASRG